MLISCNFQNIVEISLSHFFSTISHDIYLISKLKVPICVLKCLFVKLFLDESGTKWQNIPPISDHSLERISFQKKYNLRAILPIVASRRNALLEGKNANFEHICACKIS